MSKIKKENTKPELLVRKFLFKNGLRFRIHNKRLVGNPDITLPKFHTVIFVNGCFWHAHLGCKYNKLPKNNIYYWGPKIYGNVKRDKRNKTILAENGWRVLTVWECDLKQPKRGMTLNRLLSQIFEIKN